VLPGPGTGPRSDIESSRVCCYPPPHGKGDGRRTLFDPLPDLIIIKLLRRVASAPPRKASHLLRTLETRRFYLTVLYNELFGRFAGARRMRAGFLVLVTNHCCNLRCRDCGALTPYLAREHPSGILAPPQRWPTTSAPSQLLRALRRAGATLRLSDCGVEGRLQLATMLAGCTRRPVTERGLRACPWTCTDSVRASSGLASQPRSASP